MGQRIADMFRKPFRRKSVPSSPLVGARGRIDRAGSVGPHGTVRVNRKKCRLSKRNKTLISFETKQIYYAQIRTVFVYRVVVS